ncbi:MAG TPA: hypothetical protein VG102_03700 [Candidatus Paceibacterota bacterium]|jgi:hypothetical protein|nr:hypothetical protein [Candidatus Paceibacterota bacterium]
MPFYDRSLDMIVATAQAPQTIGGLTDVLSRYGVPSIIRSAARSGAPQAQAFTTAVSAAEAHGTRLFIAQCGVIVDLGGGAKVEIFFPDRDASAMPAEDGCPMFKLMFGKTSFFFSCGTPAIETYVTTLDGSKLSSDVLLTTGDEPEIFAGFVSPQYAIFPCASNASSSVFVKLQIQVESTCNRTMTFISDGSSVQLQ